MIFFDVHFCAYFTPKGAEKITPNDNNNDTGKIIIPFEKTGVILCGCSNKLKIALFFIFNNYFLADKMIIHYL